MGSSQKTPVLLIDGEHGLAFSVIYCLSAKHQTEIHVLSSDARSLVRYSRHVATFMVRANGSDDSWEFMAGQAARSTGSELLLACSTKGTEFLIRRGSRIPNVRLMQLPSLDSFRIAADKWSFYQRTQACGADSPRTWLADDQRMNETARFPVLLKPRQGEGGKGIARANDAGDLAAILRRCEATRENYIVQEFVEGTDLDCSVSCRNGRIVAWTIQESIQRHVPGFAPPWAVRFGCHAGALEQAAKIVQQLNWTGVANLGLRIRGCDGRALLLEMNPRFWASMYGSLLAGVDFVALTSSAAAAIPHQTVQHMDYYQGRKGLRAWLTGKPTDLGCRIRDPLPAIMRRLSSGSRTASPRNTAEEKRNTKLPRIL